MDLGTALFLSVILVLVVLNAKFRKVFLWSAGIAVALAAVSFAGYYVYNSYEARVEEKRQEVAAAKRLAEREVAVKACLARFNALPPGIPPPPPGFTPIPNTFDTAACEADTDAQPETPDPAKVTCGLLVDLHPDWYFVDGFGHCTLKPKKEARAKPQPTPTAPVLFHYGNDKSSVTSDRNKDAFCNSDNRKVGDVFKYELSPIIFTKSTVADRRLFQPTKRLSKHWKRGTNLLPRCSMRRASHDGDHAHHSFWLS